MYIKNPSVLKSNVYTCGDTIGNFLDRKGIPALSHSAKEWRFAKTHRLQKALDTLPLYLRFLIKVGVING